MSSDETSGAELVEAEVMGFIDEYANYEDEGIFESSSSKKSRGRIVRAYMGGGFN